MYDILNFEAQASNNIFASHNNTLCPNNAKDSLFVLFGDIVQENISQEDSTKVTKFLHYFVKRFEGLKPEIYKNKAYRKQYLDEFLNFLAIVLLFCFI